MTEIVTIPLCSLSEAIPHVVLYTFLQRTLKNNSLKRFYCIAPVTEECVGQESHITNSPSFAKRLPR